LTTNNFQEFTINIHFMYEHKRQKLAPKRVFYYRVLNNILIVISIIAVLLVVGTAGYYYFSPGAAIIDAFHNASMILSGMGPTLKTELTFSGKIFFITLCYLLWHSIHYKHRLYPGSRCASIFS